MARPLPSGATVCYGPVQPWTMPRRLNFHLNCASLWQVLRTALPE